jgi:hypothetical protein
MALAHSLQALEPAMIIPILLCRMLGGAAEHLLTR